MNIICHLRRRRLLGHDVDVAPAAVHESLIPLADHLPFCEPALRSVAPSRSPGEALVDVGERFAPAWPASRSALKVP